MARLTPLGHPTINLDGRYRTTSRPPGTGLRPLRANLLRILYRSSSQAIVWQTGTARLLPRLLKGRKPGPVFVTERKARVQLPAADLDPSGRPG